PTATTVSAVPTAGTEATERLATLAQEQAQLSAKFDAHEAEEANLAAEEASMAAEAEVKSAPAAKET
ncbi:MAG: hypothetical protein M3014_03260, partial [Chloroflexota bacterium]|nr:hypothetical protein [Chloroflexota bacterium]